MKTAKLILSIAAIAAAALLPSCGKQAQNKALETKISEINAECPTKVAEGITLAKVETKDNTVVYDIKIDVPGMTAESIAGKEENAASSIARQLVVPLQGEEIVDVCASMGIGLCYRITDSDGETCEISIPAGDLKDLSESND